MEKPRWSIRTTQRKYIIKLQGWNKFHPCNFSDHLLDSVHSSENVILKCILFNTITKIEKIGLIMYGTRYFKHSQNKSIQIDTLQVFVFPKRPSEE